MVSNWWLVTALLSTMLLLFISLAYSYQTKLYINSLSSYEEILEKLGEMEDVPTEIENIVIAIGKELVSRRAVWKFRMWYLRKEILPFWKSKKSIQLDADVAMRNINVPEHIKPIMLDVIAAYGAGVIVNSMIFLFMFNYAKVLSSRMFFGKSDRVGNKGIDDGLPFAKEYAFSHLKM